MAQYSAKQIAGFIIPSVVGILLFMIPIQVDGTWTIAVKVIADKAYGEILGVHIVGSQATELIVEAKTMMDMEITVYEVADIMHPHPTYSEAFMEACADAIGGCLNLPARH